MNTTIQGISAKTTPLSLRKGRNGWSKRTYSLSFWFKGKEPTLMDILRVAVASSKAVSTMGARIEAAAGADQ